MGTWVVIIHFWKGATLSLKSFSDVGKKKRGHGIFNNEIKSFILYTTLDKTLRKKRIKMMLKGGGKENVRLYSHHPSHFIQNHKLIEWLKPLRQISCYTCIWERFNIYQCFQARHVQFHTFTDVPAGLQLHNLASWWKIIPHTLSILRLTWKWLRIHNVAPVAHMCLKKPKHERFSK